MATVIINKMVINRINTINLLHILSCDLNCAGVFAKMVSL